jgi:hypothetical protein
MDEALLLHDLNHLHGDDKWGHLAAPLGDLLDAKDAEIAWLRQEMAEMQDDLDAAHRRLGLAPYPLTI